VATIRSPSRHDTSGGAAALEAARQSATRTRETLSMIEAAERARCSTQTLLHAVKRGDLSEIRENGYHRFDPSELESWAKARGLLLT